MRLRGLVLVGVVAIFAGGAAYAADTCMADKFAEITGYWTQAGITLADDADNNWNGIPDVAEFALLAKAMCDHPEVVDLFNANKAVATAEYARIAWDNNGLDGVAASYLTMSMDPGEGLGAVWWFLYLFNDSWQTATPEGCAAYSAPAKTASELLSAAGDYDGDGLSNKTECQYVLAIGGHRYEEYVAEASTAVSCEVAKYHMVVSYWGQAGITLADAADNNWNGIPDKYEFALLGAAMCQIPEIEAIFNDNLAIATAEYTRIGWDNNGLDGVAASYVTMSMDGGEGLGAVWWFLYLFNDVWQTETPEGWHSWQEIMKTEGEPLSAAGNFDGDAYDNLAEYQAMVGTSPEEYAYAASGGIAGAGMPVAGIVALGLLAGAMTLGGARFIRKNK